jgi:hypothetical protein
MLARFIFIIISSLIPDFHDLYVLFPTIYDYAVEKSISESETVTFMMIIQDPTVFT